MRKGRRIYPAAFLLAALGLGYWVVWAGPWYHWKPLSAWLEDYGPGPGGYKPSPKADEALRHIGPKAVPYLLQLLHATNSPAAAKALTAWVASPFRPGPNPTNAVAKVENRLMDWLENHTPIRFHHDPPPASWQHWQAYVAFQALGPLGKSAIPDLAKLAHDPSSTSFFPRIQDIGQMAKLADDSGTYRAVGDNPLRGQHAAKSHGGLATYSGEMRGSDPFLLEGEIAALSLAAFGD